MTKNPLTMIGLTPAILDLGLTPEELYAHCLRMARALFACVHPDRHHSTQRPEALHFSEAFARLKDRQVFHAALREFQDQRHQGAAPSRRQRHEEETLRARLQELQRRNSVLMRAERTLRARVHYLEQVNTILQQAVQQYEDAPHPPLTRGECARP